MSVDMRALLQMCESPDDPIASMIDQCGLTPDDRDAGTSQYCGTFALALYQTLREKGVDAHLVFAVELNPRAKSGQHYWRHVLVRVANRYYDIDGRVEPEHVLDNYVWGAYPSDLVEVDEMTVYGEIHKVRGSYSDHYFRRWLDMLTRVSLRW